MKSCALAYGRWRCAAGQVYHVNPDAARFVEDHLAFSEERRRVSVDHSIYCLVSKMLEQQLEELRLLPSEIGSFGGIVDNPWEDVDVELPDEVENGAETPAPEEHSDGIGSLLDGGAEAAQVPQLESQLNVGITEGDPLDVREARSLLAGPDGSSE